MAVDTTALTMLSERLAPRDSPYKNDPVGWIHQRAGEITTMDQDLICESIVENKYTAVRSCNGVGKSHLASRIAGWWIDSHPIGEAFVVTTAPTKAQVSAVLWRYIGVLHRKVDGMPGYITGDDTWKIHHPGSAPEPVAYGRKPADTEPEAFSGVHTRYMLVILDEGGGIPKSLYHAAISLATSQNSRLFAIGNPDDPSSYFYDVCKPGSNWNVIHLDAFRAPTMTKKALEPYPKLLELMAAEGIEPHEEEPPQAIREMLVAPGWVNERIKDYGIGTPAWESKVRGRFPEITIDTLIPPHFVEMAKQREAEPVLSQGQYGFDIARYGTDKTILVLRRGAVTKVVLEIARGPITEAAGALLAHAQETFAAHGYAMPPAAVDDTGVGGGVTDILRENGYPVIPIIAGARAVQLLPSTDPTGKTPRKPRFVNRRSELLWNLREALGGPSGSGDDGWLCLDPNDDVLHAQLTSMKYRYNSAGQIEVESKDSMKARGLPSPDRADALSYALAPDDEFSTPRVQVAKMMTSGVLSQRW